MKKTIKLVFLFCLLFLAPLAHAQQAGNQCRDLSSGLSPMLVTKQNYFWIQATGTFTSVVLSLQYRIKLPDGTLVDKNFVTPAITSATGGNGAEQQLVDGCLVSASVTLQSPNGIKTGQCYVQLFILPSSTFMVNQLSTPLMGQYISSFFSISWPIPQAPPTAGPGFNESITVGNPAAGLNFSKTFNAAQRYRIINVRFTLAAANAGTPRNVCLTFTDAAANIYQSSCAQVAQPINTTVTYNFSAGVGGFTSTPAAGLDYLVALPNWVEFSDATVLASLIGNINAGDQISAIVIRPQDWHEND